ncbi:DUF2231 domain-containing protein [Amycolatopsis benzoatilytica]|uniref:DUF2231 domain-containing protein n=1 Tax=Amycolatopsis benzoatilytica TaxID=346045 RepID=UPI00036FFEB0|nr:DUF2231 domain-containing protein [Amycolatopsis benzoatilytica]
MTTVNGLPAHILLVHAIVVLLPLSALLLVLTAWLPAVRRRLAGANAILSVLVVVLVPITTDAGEWLERRVARTALLRTHTELGDTAVWAAIPVALLALAVWWRQREAAAAPVAGARGTAGASAVGGQLPGPDGAQATGSVATRTESDSRPAASGRRTFLAPASKAVSVTLIVLSVLAAAAACYDIVRIGDSGAQVSWQGKFQQNAAPREH